MSTDFSKSNNNGMKDAAVVGSIAAAAATAEAAIGAFTVYSTTAIVPGVAGWLGATVALPVVASAGGVVLVWGLTCFAAHKVKQHFES